MTSLYMNSPTPRITRALIHADPFYPLNNDKLWRERGYCEALEALGLRMESELIDVGAFDRAVAERSVRGLIDRGVEFDAIFTGDDEAALGVLSALQAAGQRVPEDVSVVGFDDEAFAPFLFPPLTTVRAPIEQVGREAVHQLVHLIRGEPADYPTRTKGVVEKCTFCVERLDAGLRPLCVEACEAIGCGALAFGDLGDPDSPVSALLRTRDVARRKPELGTSPHVFYLL